MKRFVSLFIIIIMLLSSFSMVVSADMYDDEASMLPFTDVKEGAWYYEGIEYCYMYGIVNGMSETKFEPNGILTRAQFVQMLAMYEDVDLSLYNGLSCGFDDVKPSHWYNNAVCWAYVNGYVSGVSDTKFAPNAPITREQFARIIYLYADQYADTSYRADLSGYEDEDKVSLWAYEQVQWAVAVGIISGTSDTMLSPRSNATRAQACRMMMSATKYIDIGYLKEDAFYTLVDYICTNGVQSEYDSDLYLIEEVNGEETFVMIYDKYYDEIYFEYLMGEYEYEDYEGEITTDYERYAIIVMSDVDYGYSLVTYLSDTTEYNYYYCESDVTSRGISVYLEEMYGLPDSYVEYYSELMRTSLNAFIMKHINNSGLSFEEVMPEFVDNTDATFAALRDTFINNGIQTLSGVYDLTYTVDGKEFVFSYNYAWDRIEIYGYNENTELTENFNMCIQSLSDGYAYSYIAYSNIEDAYVDSYGYFTEDDKEVDMDYSGYTEQQAADMEAAMYGSFMSALNQLLAESGVGFADLFVTFE